MEKKKKKKATSGEGGKEGGEKPRRCPARPPRRYFCTPPRPGAERPRRRETPLPVPALGGRLRSAEENKD